MQQLFRECFRCCWESENKISLIPVLNHYRPYQMIVWEVCLIPHFTHLQQAYASFVRIVFRTEFNQWPMALYHVYNFLHLNSGERCPCFNDAQVTSGHSCCNSFAVSMPNVKYHSHYRPGLLVCFFWCVVRYQLRNCWYWKLKKVARFAETKRLITFNFHGCMIGINSKVNVPIKKPWTVATDLPSLGVELSKYRCDHSHDDIQGRGKDLKSTERYYMPWLIWFILSFA